MGWLIAGILFAIWLHSRRRLKALTESIDLSVSSVGSDVQPETDHSTTTPHRQVYELSVLRLEVDRARRAETITAAGYAELTESIDAVLSTIVHRSWAAPQSFAWAKSLDTAWALLRQHQVTLPAQPPWHRAPATSGIAARQLAPPTHLNDDLYQPVAIPALSVAAASGITSSVVPPSVVPPPQGVSPLSPVAESPAPDFPSHHSVAAEVETTPHHALDPTPPSVVERALQAVSGWPALLIPFMAQNIGWFIGGFCFVAGSVFLVSYTTGFAKSLTIFTVLFAYTLLVLWAGYQLGRRRPALVASSRVLLTIGVLLLPLNIAAAVRLILTGLPASGPVTLGLLAVALCLGGLYYAIVLVSGLVDRTLQGRHPQLFVALAAMQVTVPLLTLWPAWPVLALLHTILLGLLIYGLVRFIQDWLHAIFIEHRNTTYYAVGTLVYAALVSFIHLTWGLAGPLELPAGYYGPFLMLLCGVLFYVDAQLKQWIQHDTFLSRMSFAIYGLSILALFAAAGAPSAQELTLVLAVPLYATVMWQYVTLPPLYVLLGCSGWLYHTVVLSQVPFESYFLASGPGLAGLLYWSWRALRFQSPVLAQMSFRVWVIAGLALATWSVGHAQPGWVAIATSGLVMAMAFLGPHYIPATLFRSLPFRRKSRRGTAEPPSDLSQPGKGVAWRYAGMLAGVVTVAYTPPWFGLAGTTQLTLGLLLLAQLWALIGWRQPRRPTPAATSGVEVWFNGALLTIGLFLLVVAGSGGTEITANRALPILLVLGGGVLLQITCILGVRWIFYGVLLVAGAAGISLKLTYFPESGSGTSALSVALAIWAILWWIERRPPEMMALLREQAEIRTQTDPPLLLLWRWPASFRPYSDIVYQPLQHVMLLLGIVGLLQFGRHLLLGALGWSGVVSASLGAALALLVTGRFRWLRLLPLAISLGLASSLGTAYKLGVTTSATLSLVSTLYAMGIWRVSLWLLSHPQASRYCRLFSLSGNRHELESTTYQSAFVIMLLSLLVPLGQYRLFTSHLSLLLSLVTSMVFLWLSGQRYRRRLHYCLLLGIGTFSVVLGYLRSFYAAPTVSASRWPTLLADPGLGLTLVLIGLALWGIAWAITHRLLSPPVEETSVAMAQHLYLTPLRLVTVGLTLTAASQQLGLALLASFGVPDTGQIISIGALCLSGVTLLLANHERGNPAFSLVGILGVVLALLWAQGLWVHGSPVCSVGLLQPTCADQWFTLTWIAGGLASLARYLNRDPRWERLYSQPLCRVAAATYIWAWFGAAVLFAMLPLRAAASLPWLLLALSVGLLPVVYRLPQAAAVRGLGMGLLLTGSVASALASSGWSAIDWWLFSGWAFALWGLGNFALPRYSASWPQWRIAPDAWPWFGLSILGIVYAGWSKMWPGELWNAAPILGGYLATSALYLFLMLRNSRWAVMPWLAVLALLGAGVSFNLAWAELPNPSLALLFLCFGLGNMGWLNLLLWGAAWWRREGSTVAARLAWHDHDLCRPLVVWSLVGLLTGVLGLAALETVAILWTSSATDFIPWASVAIIGVALTLSCGHRVGLQRDTVACHVAIAAGFCTLLAIWLGLAIRLGITGWGLHLPLFLVLWSTLLLAVDLERGATQWRIPGLDIIRQAVSQWLVWSLPMAIVALGVFSQVSLVELLLILSLFGGVSACMGWQRRQAGWLVVAMSALAVQFHVVWWFWVQFHQIDWLLPRYALQLAGLVWLAEWLRHRVARPEVKRALHWQQLLLAAFALGTWLGHGFQVLAHLMGQTAPPWRLGPSEAVVAIAAPLLLIAVGLRQAKKTQRAAWIYGVAGLGGMLGLYIRLIWLGLAPVQVWDTAALIGAAYGLLGLQRLTQSRPILHLVMGLPLLALGSVPFQLTSPHASGALLTIGMLYLGTRRATDHVLPLYLGMTALNVAIYLWVPSWAHHSHLGQLYIIPAAMSLLWLLHFHRRDVKPAVLHSVRLATVSILYASAASDVFLRANVMVFIAALGLSLSGVIVGIALRTRAFLYAGVAFFVLNVAGQLVLLFPEQRLGKAIVLLILGTGITGAMIWFNAQRESILQRIRVFRSDLAEWG